jgi:glycosyltransferase 2 family protein
VLPTKRHWLTALRCAAAGAAGLLLFRVLSQGDGAEVQALLGRVGLAGAVLVVLPQLVAVSIEAYAWKLTFHAAGARPRWRSLLRVRIATEALAQSLPAGVAFAESIKPALLARHAGLTVDQSVAGMAARKVLLLISQSVYVAALAALGVAALEAASTRVVGAPHLGVVTVGVGLALGLGGLTLALLLRRSTLARSVLQLLSRLPSARLRARVARHSSAFHATDSALSTLFRASPRRLMAPLAGFGAAWLVEALETWLILALLGVPVGFATAGSIEVLLSLVRSIVFVVPAGLGVQDVGYAACFTGFGLPEGASLAAAFILLKRSKELLWIGVGYATLGSDLGALLRRPTASEHLRRLRPARA